MNVSEVNRVFRDFDCENKIDTWFLRCYVLVAHSGLTLCDPTDCSPAGYSVHGFSRQGYWSGLPFPPAGDLPNPGLRHCRQILYHMATGDAVNSQFSSVALSCPSLCNPIDCSTSGFPVHHQLPELTQTHIHWVSDAIQPSHPLSSPSPSAFDLSQHQSLFKWVSSSYQVAKGLAFQLQHQSFQWIFRTDFLRMDWLDLLAVHGTLKSLLQHHSSKASILQHSAFLTVQLSHLHMTTGKTIVLTRRTFVK